MALQEDSGGVAIRGAAIRVAGYVVGVLVSLAAAALLVRHLGIATFGRYTTVTSLVGLVGGIAEAGIQVYGISIYVAQTQEERREFTANLLAMRFALALGGIALATLFALLAGYRAVLVVGTLVIGIGLLIQVAGDVLSIALQARLELGRLAVVDFARRTLALVLTIVLVLAGAGLLPFLAVVPVAGFAALWLLRWLVRGISVLSVSFDLAGWRRLLRESLPHAVAMSIGAMYFYVTVVVMSLIASASQTGYFATSFRVIQVALGVPILLLTAVFPLLAGEARASDETQGSSAGRVFSVAVICGLWMTLATSIGARLVIDVIAGHKGHGAVSVLQIQSVMLTVSFVSTSSALGLIARRQYRPLIAASSCALVGNVLLAVVLVPALGARGGALADVVTEAFVAAALTVVLFRGLPGQFVARGFALSVCLATGTAAIFFFVPIPVAARVVFATGAFFTVLLLLGAIPPELFVAGRRAIAASRQGAARRS